MKVNLHVKTFLFSLIHIFAVVCFIFITASFFEPDLLIGNNCILFTKILNYVKDSVYCNSLLKLRCLNIMNIHNDILIYIIC